MVDWDIDGAGALANLQAVQAQVAGFEGIAERLGSALETAATQASMSGKGGPIGLAITEFVDRWKDSVPGMVEHTAAVLEGTAGAVWALENGQAEMALVAQRSIQAADGVNPRGLIRLSTASPGQQRV